MFAPLLAGLVGLAAAHVDISQVRFPALFSLLLCSATLWAVSPCVLMTNSTLDGQEMWGGFEWRPSKQKPCEKLALGSIRVGPGAEWRSCDLNASFVCGHSLRKCMDSLCPGRGSGHAVLFSTRHFFFGRGRGSKGVVADFTP